MQYQSVSTKDLKKGDIVLNYGAKFEVLEDAFNKGQQLEFLSNYTVENNANDIWIAKCRFVSGEDRDSAFMKNYDTFQSSSHTNPWSKEIA